MAIGRSHADLSAAQVARAPRRALVFLGPATLVAVGYMDPGNWATSIAAGSAFGYTLLTVVLAASLAAMLFQHLCARLGLATGMDLAQACRHRFSPRVSMVLWILAEIAILACDLAELIGAAVALKLLTGMPLAYGVLLTAFDVFLILFLLDRGVRTVEALVMGMVVLIGACFAWNLWLAGPDPAALLHGFVPSLSILTETEMLMLAVGIIGATVMPHNLYLHSALVRNAASALPQSRYGADIRPALNAATRDTCVALTFALAINCAILVLAAAAFHAHGRTDVADLEAAHHLLMPTLGSAGAGLAFAFALLLAGVASTFTGTLAGQIVMEGFIHLRLAPWLRRLGTRLIAIVPALAVTAWAGEAHTAQLLIASQVVLALQLPFALVPLLMFTTSRRLMGDNVAPRWVAVLGWGGCLLIVSLNTALLLRMAA